MITAKGRSAARFERRWTDYCSVLKDGTPKTIGSTEPRPPDMRESVTTAFKNSADDQWNAGNKALDQVWRADSALWPRRLFKPFLHGLSSGAVTSFAELVDAGCQPDALAFQFFEAVQVDQYAKDHDRILRDLNELERLTSEALDVLQNLASRRCQFDEYLAYRCLGVLCGEPGNAELKILLTDFEDLAARHRADFQSTRRQLDGRREPLLGHAEVRLSVRIHQATGAYHDRQVEHVLDELRQRMRLPSRGPGALKKKRARWMGRLRKSVD